MDDMIRPVLTAVVALGVLSLVACAGERSPAPKTPSAPVTQSVPTDGARVAIPAGREERSDPTIGSGSAATCRADCERRYRVCGEGNSVMADSGRLQPLTQTPLFSRADDCRYELQQCLNRCQKMF